MTVPGSNQIQLSPVGPPEFYVDGITDPNGAPANVIDVDQGFKVKGRVTMPNWMTGKGHVAIYADELGGQIDKKIGQKDFDIGCGSFGVRGQAPSVYWPCAVPG